MRKLLLGSVVAMFVGGSALAADLLPEKAPAAAPPPTASISASTPAA
jgi:hypothetical protein